MSSPAKAQARVRAWGYPHVFTWTDAPNAHYPPHTHRVRTTHLILDGTLTIAYPSDTTSITTGTSTTEEGKEEDEERGGKDRERAKGGKGGQKAEREQVTWGKGARIDVPAGRVHEVWVGAEGCRYVIGEGEG